MTDQQLVLRVKAGEDWAFEELAARHGGLVDGNCAFRSVPGEERDDLQQAALMGLFRAAQSYRPDCGTTFKTWAERLVRQHVAAFSRMAAARKQTALSGSACLDDYRTALASSEPDPCERAIARETLADQVRVLSGCSATQREVVTRRLNGLSLADAGNGRKNTANNALIRVRKKLAASA